jgi:hypothetical protein
MSGYILEMKVLKIKKETESFYILGHLLELIIKIWQCFLEFKKSSKSGKFLVISFMKNPLSKSKSYFFSSRFGKIL